MPSTERTPLIQQVPIADYRERYPNHLLRRYCTIALTTIPLLTVVIVLLSVAIGGESDVFGEHEITAPSYLHSSSFELRLPHSSWPESDGLDYAELMRILQETPDPDKAREWSKYYTAGPHLCGKNLSQAEWTRDKWAEFGIPHTEIVSYDMYLNYPVDHRLALLENDEVIYEATLEEDVLQEDPTTGLSDRVPVFHGYSASGNVTASYVFCNYGTFYDFEDLRDAGVELEGKIALVKYGHVFRGLKVKRASELGMVGVIMYSDPGDDGEMTEQNGYKAYPNGPARNPSSVQRGSVQYLSVAPGDPTTIGYPSKPDAPRESTEGIIPDIPSLPISYAEALPFLKALNGYGPNVSSFSKYWQGGGLGYKGVEYNIGPTPESLTINLMNEQDYVITPAWNAIGIINGSISDEVVVLGNHRDAWIAGGAGDPNSGSAAMNEVIRAFGVALSRGWKPLRTIVFASWDGEEYGLLGSTEWVEEYIPWLSESTVAYINVDVGARGSNFQASAAPVLNKALLEVTAEVQSPNQTVKGQSVRDTWDGYISTMGSGSDFTAFQDFAGIPSIDVGFGGGPNDPVYHYHSNYDSFWWMENYGDPGFEHHIAIAKILALLTAKLAEEPVVQFNATDYAFGLQKYLQDAKDEAASYGIGMLSDGTFEPLDKAIEAFQRASATFDSEASWLSQQALSLPSTTMTAKLYQSIRTINTKYKLLERQFLYAAGLDGRSWFKHVIFAPGLWTGYAGKTYPGLVEAIDEKNQSAVDKWVNIIEGTINRATDLLIPK
ncbi:hypothetical protein LTR37_000079 [Vermiconidia calcicola]|uniref:Uncharacterized protein n=1 Tax=Vermiconidia calcicola TaxID=1690605 RepID=A0ACC3NZG6_9PEZI|nr:hypothetical protein LTR37_000079 [Vermiconidia calcicola]